MNFEKEKFSWDGMYLMYHGDQGSMNKYYEMPCHPTREGKLKCAFIARFKYGSKPWKSFVNFLVKNFSVEEYLKLEAESSPVAAMKSKGYLEPKEKKELKLKGYPVSVAGYDEMMKDEVAKWDKAS